MPKETTKPRVNAHHAIPDQACNTSGTRTPSNRKQARAAPDADQWGRAYDEELARHAHFGTFTRVPRSSLPVKAFVPKVVTTWSKKYDSEGQVTSRKVRFSYPGNRLLPGIHYNPNETSTYTENYKGETWIFLEEIPEFDGGVQESDIVLRVDKNIYGTPDASRTYIDGLHGHLQAKGYKQCRSDRHVYTRYVDGAYIVIAITVDDFLAASNDDWMLDQLVMDLQSKYEVKDLGLPNQLLGWSVTQNMRGDIHISQSTLADTFLDLVRMQAVDPARTPYQSGARLQAREKHEERLDGNIPHRQALGILRYMVDSTRPDLAYIVGVLARTMADPTHWHWQSVKHVARYIRHTRTHGLLYLADTSGGRKTA